MSKESEENLISIHIDEEKEFCPYCTRKTEKGTKITHSDHNAIILNVELNMNRRGKVKETTKPIWRLQRKV